VSKVIARIVGTAAARLHDSLTDRDLPTDSESMASGWASFVLFGHLAGGPGRVRDRG